MTEAILEQLRAEIAIRSNVKAIAEAMGIDYWTFRKYVNGERELPLDVLTRALAVLGLDYPTFASRAAARRSTHSAD
jgi:hypothetical protein